MKKEVADKVLKENNTRRITFYKKMWYSITKFEKYPEMAAEGVGRAFLYLVILSLLVAVIMSGCITFQISQVVNMSTKYFKENINKFEYEDGKLNIDIADDNHISSDFGTVIIDTGEVSEEQMNDYERKISSNSVGIIWLNERAILKYNGRTAIYNYKEILDNFNVSDFNFNKENVLNFLENNINTPAIYLSYFAIQNVILFIAFFLATLIDILILSAFGMLTALIAKIRLRYRAVFNMSVYAITLSVILQTIYRVANVFVSFDIKYFDVMYQTIAYICLAAAIFMIRSDVIKQQIELMKLMQEKREQQENKQEEENKEEDKKTDKEEKNDEKEEKQDEDKNLKPETEGQS